MPANGTRQAARRAKRKPAKSSAPPPNPYRISRQECDAWLGILPHENPPSEVFWGTQMPRRQLDKWDEETIRLNGRRMHYARRVDTSVDPEFGDPSDIIPALLREHGDHKDGILDFTGWKLEKDGTVVETVVQTNGAPPQIVIHAPPSPQSPTEPETPTSPQSPTGAETPSSGSSLEVQAPDSPQGTIKIQTPTAGCGGGHPPSAIDELTETYDNEANNTLTSSPDASPEVLNRFSQFSRKLKRSIKSMPARFSKTTSRFADLVARYSRRATGRGNVAPPGSPKRRSPTDPLSAAAISRTSPTTAARRHLLYERRSRSRSRHEAGADSGGDAAQTPRPGRNFFGGRSRLAWFSRSRSNVEASDSPGGNHSPNGAQSPTRPPRYFSRDASRSVRGANGRSPGEASTSNAGPGRNGANEGAATTTPVAGRGSAPATTTRRNN
ncbi:hypothetical protein FN846DRAFT_906863 [Sphaerosporella brunnea]|uniref:Uncharacterized protein n=1 Tax=Sphaerosporella brunnea TaxID=1250544 RepID=A0A5J5EXF9_9PEZI|nr:hypothetical protein FN846DRAFT_906863 [Sphaerosporella brunnea]